MGWLATTLVNFAPPCHNEGAASLVGIQAISPTAATPTATSKRFIGTPELPNTRPNPYHKEPVWSGEAGILRQVSVSGGESVLPG